MRRVYFYNPPFFPATMNVSLFLQTLSLTVFNLSSSPPPCNVPFISLIPHPLLQRLQRAKMDLLRSQFARSDATKRGSVSVSEFKTALQRFGVKGGLDPVVKKFTRAEGVDYESFLKHFQGRQTGGAQPSHSGASSVRDPPQHAVDVATPNTSQLAPSWVNPNTPRESVRFSDSASAKQQPRRAEEHHQQHQQHHQHQQQQQHIERSNPDAHMEHSNPPPPPPPVQRHQDVPSFVQKEVSGGGGAPRTTQSEAKYHLPITPQTTYAGRAGAFDGIDVRRYGLATLNQQQQQTNPQEGFSPCLYFQSTHPTSPPPPLQRQLWCD